MLLLLSLSLFLLLIIPSAPLAGGCGLARARAHGGRADLRVRRPRLGARAVPPARLLGAREARVRVLGRGPGVPRRLRHGLLQPLGGLGGPRRRGHQGVLCIQLYNTNTNHTIKFNNNNNNSTTNSNNSGHQGVLCLGELREPAAVRGLRQRDAQDRQRPGDIRPAGMCIYPIYQNS